MTKIINNPVVLKDGKFYRNGIEEKPIIGDKDQIEAMIIVQAVSDAVRGDGLILDDIEEEIQINIKTDFRCLCGQKIFFENTREEHEDNIEELSKLTEKCRSCERVYKTSQNEDGELVVKLHKEKKK